MSLMNVNPVDPARPERVAIVTASAATKTSTGWPVGVWWSELTRPYPAFLVTGQQSFPGAETARLVIEAVGA